MNIYRVFCAQTSVDLVSSFFNTIWVCIMRFSLLFYTSRVWVFYGIFDISISFVVIYHVIIFIPWYSCPNVYVVFNGIDPINNLGI